ncbi:HAD family hydrolase [Streptomyces sp. NPDC049906]|uniref:HAD family hydrolase n=1 Tax=Streptomyces sp. NPDC049906 TaxID=3155656 RepID=UPI003449F446
MTTAPRTDRDEPRTVLVASDLDRTLIYSAAALGLNVPDAEAPRLLCVEVYQGKPLSYLTETAADLLAELARTTHFVPTTTRTLEQYRRIHLPGPAPRHAICANGGQILVDGVPDPAWQRHVVDRITAECAPLEEIGDHLRRTADPRWLLKERTADDFFAYLVVERSLLPEQWVKDLAVWSEERGWTVSLQGRKIYVVPRPLTKSAALREVLRRTGAAHTLAAGDSLLDADLLLAADQAWRPSHGELADEEWRAPHLTVLPQKGATAGEQIVKSLVRAAALARA